MRDRSTNFFGVSKKWKWNQLGKVRLTSLLSGIFFFFVNKNHQVNQNISLFEINLNIQEANYPWKELETAFLLIVL